MIGLAAQDVDRAAGLIIFATVLGEQGPASGSVIHRIFDPARLDIEVTHRFGNPVIPREWFLVPLFAIEEAVGKIMDGTINRFVYDPATARLTGVWISLDDVAATMRRHGMADPTRQFERVHLT